MQAKRVGVLGADLIGAGMAEVAARAASEGILVDVDANANAGAKARGRIYASVRKSAEKGQFDSTAAAGIVGRIRNGANADALAVADLVIEAAFENLAVKKEAFKKLDAVALPDAVLASNTVAAPVRAISAVTKRPDKVMGLHFFYPAPRMRLVEVVRGLATTDDPDQRARSFVEAIGKTGKHAPASTGFIFSRLLPPMLCEAVICAMEGAKPKDADAGKKLGCNFPMRPLGFAGLRRHRRRLGRHRRALRESVRFEISSLPPVRKDVRGRLAGP
jgi:3-hydroxybutyryl-CoA dehydrogenase